MQGVTFLGAGERCHQVQLHHSCLGVIPGCSGQVMESDRSLFALSPSVFIATDNVLVHCE